MAKQHYSVIAGLVISLVVLLSACQSNPNSDRNIKKSADARLKELTTALVWKNSCVTDFNNIVINSDHTKRAFVEVVVRERNSVRGQYIEKRMIPKLEQLKAEAQTIVKRCQSPNYDASGVSIERPDMLREMMNEWRGTLIMLSKELKRPPQLDQKIARATLTGSTIHQATAPGTQFKDCSDNYCLHMVVITKGNFTMGGNEGEQKKQKVSDQSALWEVPAHPVDIMRKFAMSQYETTVQQFTAFQKETGWQVQGCRNWEMRNGHFTMVYREDLNPQNVGFKQTPNDPVVCVRREDAQAYADWYSKKTGHKYRLPTEAEFEYAMRASSATAFYWGDDIKRDVACDYANVLDISTVKAIPATQNWTSFQCNDGFPYTAPVGKFFPNKFGLYDINGNAREWVSDCWHPNYKGAPKVSLHWGEQNNGECNFPILRGGAWIYNVSNVRSAYRNAYLSSQARSNMWGFRLVRDIGN